MMNRITIRNIGPIKDVTLNLNKINVIMGPQSSGKSTIAKIISYCQWVEKRLILDGVFDYDFTEQFMDFHRISDVYFNENSLIEYKSNSTHISYNGLNHKSTIRMVKEGMSFVNCKNIYIPAERNFVSVIPNLGKYKRTNDNIMNFLYDWYEVKKKYSKENTFPILNLDVSFYHTQETDSDTLVLKNNAKKELLLNNASSGLQSVIPMILLIDYLTNGLYNEKTIESVNEIEELFNILAKQFSKIIESKERRSTLIKEMKEEKKIKLSSLESEKLIEFIAKRKKYHFSQIIIEEPEQNLFPETQRDLVYYLLHMMNNEGRDHKLLLTTHSPYILYALNNCMMGYLIKDEMPEIEQNELASKQSWIDPKLVSVWEIEKDKGTVKLIQDKNTGTVSKHYFNSVMNETMDEYYEMLNYLKI